MFRSPFISQPNPIAPSQPQTQPFMYNPNPNPQPNPIFPTAPTSATIKIGDKDIPTVFA